MLIGLLYLMIAILAFCFLGPKIPGESQTSEEPVQCSNCI
jgi:hypothetical protein